MKQWLHCVSIQECILYLLVGAVGGGGGGGARDNFPIKSKGAKSSIIGGGGIFIYSKTVKTIDFKRN